MDSLTAENQQESLQAVMPLLEEGRHAEALPLVEESLAKAPDDPLWSYLKALVLACMARGNEALPLLRETAKHAQFRAHFGLSTELNTLWTTSALNHLKFETSVEPSDPQPWAILDEFARTLHNVEYQKQGYVARLKVDPENSPVMEALQKLLADMPPEETVPALEEILEEQPDACRPRALLGYHLQRKGKTALAIRHLKTALEADANAVEPHLYLGRIFASQHKFEDAERELQEAIDKGNEPSAQLLTEMANCQKATYRYEEALETLFSALELDPTNFEAWEELTELAQATGHGARLQNSVARAVEQHPENLNLRRRLILLCMSNEDPLAARKHLQSTGVFEQPGKDLVFARLAAELSMALGETRVATEMLEATLQAQPNSPVLRLLYGQALQRDLRPQEAESVLRDTSKHHPNDIELQIAWGKSLKGIGEIERATHAFGLASRLDPDDPEAMAEQGLALLALGRTEEAQNLLKESAKKVEPPLAATLIGLGSLYEQKGMKEVAHDFFRDALIGDGSNDNAAAGWFRTLEEDADLSTSSRELIGRASTSFQKSLVYVTLLKAVFLESDTAKARTLKAQIFPAVLEQLDSEEYKEFLASSEARMLPALAKELEMRGELERTREIWRYAVGSPMAELAEQASTELVRLDTFEGQPAVDDATPGPSVEEEAPVEGEDLLNLLSSTIPADAPAEEEQPLFSSSESEAAVEEEASLFHEPEAVAAPPEEAGLFTEEASELFAEPEAVETPPAEAEMFLEPEAVTADDPALEGDLFAEPEVAVVQPEEVQTLDSEVEGSLFVEHPESVPEDQPESELQAVAEAQPEAEVQLTTEAQPVPEAEPVSEVQPVPEAEPLAPEQNLESPLPEAEPEDSLEESGSLFPSTEAPAVVPEPVAAPQVPAPTPPAPEVRKELLPIPMAVDFQPLTRRQLHYHEVLTQSAAGVVNPESVAHLLLQSSLTHEPPDPGSEAGPSSSTASIQQALLAGAYHLEQATQYRGAARILKTALLYNPSNTDVLEALARVQSHWAHWLVQRQEYAHAVSLLRDTLQRQPQRTDVEGQLGQIYHHWMAWSEDAGDPAAKALLSVYLEQEKASLEALRAEWQARQAAPAPTPTPPVQAAPPVAPEMPEPAPPAPVAEAPVAEAPAVAEPVVEEPAAEEPSVMTAMLSQIPDPEPPATEPAPVAAAVAEPEPAAAPEPVAAEPAVAEPVAAEPAAAEPVAAEPAIAEPAVAEPAVAEPVVATPEPEPVAPEPEPVAAEPEPAAPAAEIPSFASKEEALAALEADPTEQPISEALFSFYTESMRDLTGVLRERVSGNPDQPMWLLYLARAFRRSGSETMAVIQYQKYIKAAPSLAAYEELAQTYEQIGKEDFANMTRRKAERAFG